EMNTFISPCPSILAFMEAKRSVGGRHFLGGDPQHYSRRLPAPQLEKSHHLARLRSVSILQQPANTLTNQIIFVRQHAFGDLQNESSMPASSRCMHQR